MDNSEQPGGDVSAVPIDGGTRLVLAGEIDFALSERLIPMIGEAMRDGGDLEFEASRVTFVDSGGLRTITHALGLANEGQRVVIVDPSPMFAKLLEITGLAGIFGLPTGPK